MKRILPLILLLVCGFTSLNAQIRVFKDITCTQEIKDGDRITFLTAEEDPYEGVHIMGSNAPYFAPSDFSTPTDYEVSITLMGTDGAQYSAYWCGVSMSCSFVSGTSEKREGTTKGSKLGDNYLPGMGDDMELHLNFTPGAKGNVTVKVDVTCDGDPVLTFYEMYYYDGTAVPASIANANSDNALRFSGNSFNYSFDTTAPRTFNVFGVDGKLVKSEALSTQNGTLNVDGLTRGAYIYQLTENGKRTKSGKFIVK